MSGEYFILISSLPVSSQLFYQKKVFMMETLLVIILLLGYRQVKYCQHKHIYIHTHTHTHLFKMYLKCENGNTKEKQLKINFEIMTLTKNYYNNEGHLTTAYPPSQFPSLGVAQKVYEMFFEKNFPTHLQIRRVAILNTVFCLLAFVFLKLFLICYV